MKPYEFMRFYHPKLGKFVYKHKGSGIIVDNIFKPMKSVVSSVVKKFVKPLGKKAIESGISNAGDRLGKKISEKSGDLQYCAKVMQTKFVEIRPLFPRLFYEKSSNFRKMFRRVLSEKITIFLEISRERNLK